jgi:hypothetical protein
MTWEVSNEIPTITGYEHLPPSTETGAGSSDITIIHSDDVVFHRFPGQITKQNEIEAECAAWVPEIITSPILRVLHPSMEHDGTQWTAVLAVDPGQRQIENIRRSKYLIDIETDIVGIGREGRVAFIGRRGMWLWYGCTNEDGSLGMLDRAVIQDDAPVADQCRQHLEELFANTDLPTLPLIVFGDAVDPSLLRELSTSLIGKVDPVQRFNPFRFVRSSLDTTSATDVLRRAHLLGTIVGAM